MTETGVASTGERPKRSYRNLKALWFAVCISICIWAVFQTPGWDAAIYRNAMHSLQAEHDPYIDAIRIQKLIYSRGPIPPGTDTPYSYVYPPITLPILGFFSKLPIVVEGLLYWPLYITAILAQLWVGLLFPKGREKRIFVYLTPVALFFPGLLVNETILSGNIAHVLYAAILLAAVIGWRHNKWRWFYIAVLAASCVKAPYLSLVAIPVLSARKQWMHAGITTLASIALFVIQAFLWPSLFHNYLEAVELMFSLNHDFGCSVAGLFSQWLAAHHLPYFIGSLFYLAYALPLAVLLFYLSRKYFARVFLLKEWGPILLVGVILLNPRLIEYDVAPITLPLALIAWRVASSCTTKKRAGITLAILFFVANAFALTDWNLRKMIDGPLLVIIFLAGSWHLLRGDRLVSDTIKASALNQSAFLDDKS